MIMGNTNFIIIATTTLLLIVIGYLGRGYSQILFYCFIIGYYMGYAVFYLNSVNFYQVGEKALAVGLLAFPFIISDGITRYNFLMNDPLAFIIKQCIVLIVGFIVVFLGAFIKNYLVKRTPDDEGPGLFPVVFSIVFGCIVLAMLVVK